MVRVQENQAPVPAESQRDLGCSGASFAALPESSGTSLRLHVASTRSSCNSGGRFDDRTSSTSKRFIGYGGKGVGQTMSARLRATQLQERACKSAPRIGKAKPAALAGGRLARNRVGAQSPLWHNRRENQASRRIQAPLVYFLFSDFCRAAE